MSSARSHTLQTTLRTLSFWFACMALNGLFWTRTWLKSPLKRTKTISQDFCMSILTASCGVTGGLRLNPIPFRPWKRELRAKAWSGTWLIGIWPIRIGNLIWENLGSVKLFEFNTSMSGFVFLTLQGFYLLL